MMNDDLDEDPRIVALLNAERSIAPLESELAARLRRRVWSSIALGVGGDPGDGGSGADGSAGGADGSGAAPGNSVAGSSAASSGLNGGAAQGTGLLGQIANAKGIVATAFALGVATGGAGVGAALTANPEPPGKALRAGLANAAAGLGERPVARRATPASTPAPPAPPAHAASGASRSVVATPLRDEDLGAERALLAMARTAVGRRDASGALVALQRHKQRFPKGRLSEERESLWIQALLLDGQTDDAERRVQSFRTRYPDSMLGRGLSKAIADADGGR